MSKERKVWGVMEGDWVMVARGPEAGRIGVVLDSGSYPLPRRLWGIFSVQMAKENGRELGGLILFFRRWQFCRLDDEQIAATRAAMGEQFRIF